MSISNKTAIITGAAGGIGSALVKAYLELNYNVVANGRNSANLEAMAVKLGNPERLLLISGDIGKPETSKKLFAKAIERFNKVDVLINNEKMRYFSQIKHTLTYSIHFNVVIFIVSF